MFDRLKTLLSGEKPVDPATLMRDGKLVAAAIESTSGTPAALKPLLATPAAPAAAIIAGISGADLRAELLPLLKQEGLTGRAAAWALGRLGAESDLLAAVAEGGLDQRDNAYWGLAVLAGAGKATPALAPALRARVEAEIAKAKGGGTGLGEHAVRALAVLGDAEAGRLAQAVVDGDRFCDRFELQRIKKATSDGSRDREALHTFTVPWPELFADHLYSEPAPKPVEKPAEKPAAKAPAPVPVSDAPPSYDLEAGEPAADEPGAPAGGGQPVDWKAFLASPEAATLQPQVKQMAGQLGQLLEQLAQRAVGAQLTDLSRDEFAALLMQVLPQALPQQHVQAALSPHAMNAYQALAKFLSRTKAATQGDGLLEGVKMVRKMMQDQVRRAGILDGPDYSDPDDKKPTGLVK